MNTRISAAGIGLPADLDPTIEPVVAHQLLLAAALGLPGGASPCRPGETVMDLFREWQATHALAEDRSTPEEEAERAFDRMSEIEDRMIAIPSKTAQDVAAKICAWSGFGFSGLDGTGSDALWAELRGLVGA